VALLSEISLQYSSCAKLVLGAPGSGPRLVRGVDDECSSKPKTDLLQELTSGIGEQRATSTSKKGRYHVLVNAL
jgi:hypothetical protein